MGTPEIYIASRPNLDAPLLHLRRYIHVLLIRSLRVEIGSMVTMVPARHSFVGPITKISLKFSCEFAIATTNGLLCAAFC